MHSEDFERKAKSAGEAWRRRIGTALKRARAEKGLSQEVLADLIGATAGTISEIERGLTVPGLGTAWAIADRLGMPIDMVVGRSSRFSLLEDLTLPENGAETAVPPRGDRARIRRLEAELREMRRLVDDLLSSEGQSKSKKRGVRSA